MEHDHNAEHDHFLEEDRIVEDDSQKSPVNKLLDSITYLASVITKGELKPTAVMLFLDNVEALRAKLPKAPFQEYFPAYTGHNTIDDVVRYITRLFYSVIVPGVWYYHHLINSTNDGRATSDFVKSALGEAIICHNLHQSLL